jgi:hypothetical protein
VLRACREVLKQGGRLAFYTIYIPPGLPPDVYQRAKGAAPGAAGSRQAHQSMLASAGFKEIREIDVTPQYLATIRAVLAGRQRHERALRREAGDAEFERRVTENGNAAAAVDEGLLRRSLFLARRPR